MKEILVRGNIVYRSALYTGEKFFFFFFCGPLWQLPLDDTYHSVRDQIFLTLKKHTYDIYTYV